MQLHVTVMTPAQLNDVLFKSLSFSIQRQCKAVLSETRYYHKRNKHNRLGDYVFNLEFKRVWVRSCGRSPFILISFPSIEGV